MRRCAAAMLVLFVACKGDDEVGPPDAPTPDAPDAAVDAADPDAAIDAPMPDAPPIDAPMPDAPPIDAPMPDAPPPIDAPIDAPVPPPTLTILFAGNGTGIVRSGTAIECAGGPCTYVAGGSYTLTQTPLSGSTFVSWSGCTPSGNTCVVNVGAGGATVTVTYDESSAVAWSRSAAGCPRPIDAALAPGGFVVAGTTEVGAQTWARMWIGRYASDGTPGPAFVDDVSSGEDRPIRIVADPGGDTLVVASINGVLGLRRYTATGTLVYAVAPGGTSSLGVDAGLALDGSGNIYVSGIAGGVPYIVSYLPSGTERWRVNAPAGVDSIQGLTVRGAVLAAVGNNDPAGWVGTFDVADGNLRWQRTIPGLTMNPSVAFDDVATSSAGDVIVGGLDLNASPGMYMMAAVTADNSAVYRQGLLPTRWDGELRVSSDDTTRVWIGYATVGQEPSRLLSLDAAGSQSSSSTMPYVFGPGGLAVDASGTSFMAGYDWNARCAVIQARP